MKIHRVFLMTSVLFVAYSCKKEGIEGKADVFPVVQHHEKAIPGATVYIKYGATEFPGAAASNYDDRRVCDSKAKTKFNDLLPGNYYFYGVGYDSSIRQDVKGGVPFEITRKQKKSNIDLTIHVTE